MKRLIRLLVISIFCLSLVPAISASTPLPSAPSILAQDNGEIPYIEWDDCPFLMPDVEEEGDTVDCGYMITLEDPFDADSELIEIAFAIFYSQSDNPEPDPVVYLEGGPGGSALAGIDWWIDHPMREDRDIVLIDQRGTGYSLPSLNCDELDYAYEDIQFDEDAAMEECYQRLVADGIDLANYNTVTNAIDVADLIELLDYAPANLFGISYGTRLALAVMRDHPEVVRSAIIDSVYPANVDAYAESPLNTVDAFSRLFGRCAADAACNAAFPDLESIFYETVANLNDSPAVFSVYDDWEEEDTETEVTGDDLVDTLFQAMYDSTLIPVLPAAIAAMADGDYETAYDLYTYGSPDMEYDEEEDYYSDYDDDELYDFYDEIESLGDAEAMFNILECQDEVAFSDYDLALQRAEAVRPEIRDLAVAEIEDIFAMCELWSEAAAPDVENEAVVSAIPTLVMSGELDPVTPPAWAALAAETLSHSFYFDFPGQGHGVTDSECGMAVALQFLATPDRAPDASCLAGMGVDFYIP